MISTVLRAAILPCSMLTAGQTAATQPATIRVKFEVNGKQSSKPFRVLLSAGDRKTKPQVFEPAVKDGSFLFPAELSSREEVAVRFISGKHRLYFPWVKVPKSGGEWAFGVERRTPERAAFCKEPHPLEDKELVGAIYVRIQPDEGPPDRQVVCTYR